MKVDKQRVLWRVAAAPHDVVVLRGADVPHDDRDEALPGAVLAGRVDGWMRDPVRRVQLLRICRDALSRDDADDAHSARMLRRAFELGRLVAFHLDRVRVEEGVDEIPDEEFAPDGTPEARDRRPR